MAVLAPPAVSGVSTKTVERAVNALLKWRDSKSETQKPQLLEADEFVYLVLTLKKIPQKPEARTNAYKLPLPHPLMQADDALQQLCLIIDDRPKTKSKSKPALTKDIARKKIQNDGIPISKIIKLSKLRTDYRPFEAKRKLCDSYDLFLADKSLIPLLPKLLGKHFFKKKKIPVGVDLTKSNWKEQVERVCSSALLFLTTGTCSVVKVGRVSMSREEIVENVASAIDEIANLVPRKWGGIRSLHLKLLGSLALPLYQAVPDLKLKIEGAEEDFHEETEADGEHKLVTGKVKQEEKKGKKKKKGRIHEVRYMDSNDNVNAIGDSDKEGDVEDDGAAELDSELQVGKKRNRESTGARQKKVASEVNREEVIKQKKQKKKDKNHDGVKKKKQKKAALTLD
ncbi:hypothetical protein Tsubulata_014356 [Turnera subulata]|uniref:Ribosomal protein n=1 Tax=Turnera subulata TaxID=218843 RepID=A0A9Q0F5C9_9ROSI|nr:hypothetical protein Tsubulata_014356 [Turnera subulata]